MTSGHGWAEDLAVDVSGSHLERDFIPGEVIEL